MAFGVAICGILDVERPSFVLRLMMFYKCLYVIELDYNGVIVLI